jgi:hypothetical protein
MEVSGQLHATAALIQGKSSGIHCIGGWVGPRTGLDDVERRKYLAPTGTRTPTDHFLVHPVAIRYTNYALPVPNCALIHCKITNSPVVICRQPDNVVYRSTNRSNLSADFYSDGARFEFQPRFLSFPLIPDSALK